MPRIIHTRIAKVAKTICAECYEVMAQEDAFYRLWPDIDRYIKRRWMDYIPFARQSLAGVLAKDYSFEISIGSMSMASVEQMKQEIYEALIIDSSAKENPREPPPEIIRLRERFGSIN